MNPGSLDGQCALLIVSGGVSAFKSAIVARELMRRGAVVDTVLTSAAQRFITPLTFAAITGRAPYTELWNPSFSGELHIELTQRATVIVIAPATADLMARVATGLADDLATACLLAAECPLVFAPAMHSRMWSNPATRTSVSTLTARGAHFVGPVDGPLASGESGLGRMAEPSDIVSAVHSSLSARDLSGCHVVVTAGGTHEAIDPVRFIGNRSSGRMGYAVAAAALSRGAAVTLITAPSALSPPHGATVVRVRSALEMHAAVSVHAQHADVVIMAAAVADYRPAEVSAHKLKKNNRGMTLELVANPDILASLGDARAASDTPAHPLLVGFAVETEDLVSRARDKLTRKHCDLIVANLADDGFEGETNRVVLVTRDESLALSTMSKHSVAGHIIDRVVSLHSARAHRPSPTP